MSMDSTSDARLKEVLSYVNDRGLEDALKFFDLAPSTIKRYRREAERRNLDIQEDYDEPRILVFDLETAPLEVYTFDTGKEYIQHENIKKGRSLLSWSAKWLCESDVMSDRATVDEARERNDARLVDTLHSLLDEADILLGHNIRYFDKKVANSRFLVNGLEPPSTYEMIDTYRQARKNFDFTSNSLDYLTKKLCKDKEDKGDHGMDLWISCVEGDESALETMEEYNRKDVRINEDLHFKLRSYYTSGVNIGLYYDDIGNRCPRCGSKDLRLGKKGYFTATGKYKTIRCNECGAIGRERYMDLETEKRKSLLRTTAH